MWPSLEARAARSVILALRNERVSIVGLQAAERIRDGVRSSAVLDRQGDRTPQPEAAGVAAVGAGAASATEASGPLHRSPHSPPRLGPPGGSDWALRKLDNGIQADNFKISVTANVPEPTTVALGVVGAAFLGASALRRNRR